MCNAFIQPEVDMELEKRSATRTGLWEIVASGKRGLGNILAKGYISFFFC